MYSTLSTLNTRTEVPLSKALNPQLLPGRRNINGCPQLWVCVHQCWGKLLLKVMHYNIALLPKKLQITLLSYFLWKVMHYVTFTLLSSYFLNMSRAWLFVCNTRSSIESKCKSPFTPKSVINKPQAKGKVNSLLYSRTQEKKFQHSSAIIKKWSTIVSLSKVNFAY